jgi:hypothetical protein
MWVGMEYKNRKKIRIHFVIYLSMPTRENPVGSHKENICGYGMKYKLTKWKILHEIILYTVGVFVSSSDF